MNCDGARRLFVWCVVVVVVVIYHQKNPIQYTLSISSKNSKKNSKYSNRSLKKMVKSVVIHPLVLLSVVDHYNRVAKDTSRRVVGVLLGEISKGKVDVTNSFAVPYESDKKDPTVWFVDHNYLEEMAAMFRKVNARELIVGFYSSSPKIEPSDLAIAELFRRFCKDPVFTIIDVRADREDSGLPVKAFKMVEEIQEGTETKRVFQHIPSEIGAYEAEEVGVEHLLRDVNDPTISTLAERIRHQITALKGLRNRLSEMSRYIDDVANGKRKVNNQIIYNIQTIVNKLPNLNLSKLVQSFMVKTNDIYLVLYVASIIRSITALHDLVNNKLKFRDMKTAAQKKEEDEKKKKQKEEEAKKKKADDKKEQVETTSGKAEDSKKKN